MKDSHRVAVATTSRLAADAAAEVADLGGNAVDCAIAASMLTMNTEPGVCALAGGAYVTVWHADEDPVTIDGNVAVPGRGLGPNRPPDRGVDVHMEYGAGIHTVVGCASVATPGSLAALALASQRYGVVGWRQTLDPSVRAAAAGFPLSTACHYYLEYSGGPVFSRSTDGYRALHDDDGLLLDAGSTIVVAHLAESLAAIAAEGADLFYRGELAARIADHVRDGGGALTRDDLADYAPIVRPALTVDMNGWRIATNPPPAVGGAVLAAMLSCFAEHPVSAWDEPSLRRLLQVQHAALSYRKHRLDLCDDVALAADELLNLAARGELLSRWASASTVHTSAVDSNGLGCAITASSGYGSGEMPSGTGLWLNNCLGELELNRRGLDAGPPGVRLPSNMAPGVARGERGVLAFGSPGADRITTALHQFLVNHIELGLPLEQSIAHPRLHLDVSGDRPSLAVEPGLDMPELDIDVTRYPALNMYFGGVGAALLDRAGNLAAAADPRREGGIFC